MNILIPMAGLGSRFSKKGYKLPKPLIKIKEKTIVEYAIDSVPIKDANFIFIVRKEHLEEYDLKTFLSSLVSNCKIVVTDVLTEGQACSALLAKDHINNDEPLMIVNSDNYFVWDCAGCVDLLKNENIDGVIPTFFDNSGNKAWSYAKTNDDGKVIETAEKRPISSNAIAGIFLWKKGSDFVKFSEKMIEQNVRVNNEFYIAPSYNQAIEENLGFCLWEIEKMFPLGTPEEAEVFEEFLIETEGKNENN